MLNSTDSGNVGISTGGGLDLGFSKDFNFALQELMMGAVFNDGVTVAVTGYDDGSATGTQTFAVDSTTSTLLQMDQNIFDSVDEVLIQTTGGTLNPAYAGVNALDTTSIYLDYMTIA